MAAFLTWQSSRFKSLVNEKKKIYASVDRRRRIFGRNKSFFLLQLSSYGSQNTDCFQKFKKRSTQDFIMFRKAIRVKRWIKIGVKEKFKKKLMKNLFGKLRLANLNDEKHEGIKSQKFVKGIKNSQLFP